MTNTLRTKIDMLARMHGNLFSRQETAEHFYDALKKRYQSENNLTEARAQAESIIQSLMLAGRVLRDTALKIYGASGIPPAHPDFNEAQTELLQRYEMGNYAGILRKRDVTIVKDMLQLITRVDPLVPSMLHMLEIPSDATREAALQRAAHIERFAISVGLEFGYSLSLREEECKNPDADMADYDARETVENSMSIQCECQEESQCLA